MRIALVVFCLFMAAPLFAQGTVPQVKFVTHTPVPAKPGWYPAGWSITNIKDREPDNTNIMLGVGRKLNNGWVEVMAQRQYAIHTSQWFLDFRLSRKLAQRVTMFVEVSPFLEKPAVYQFARVEYRIGPINLMAETENIYRRNEPDSLGIGPGISLPPRKLYKKLKFAPALSWQWRPKDTDRQKSRDQDPNFVRFYSSFSF